MTKDQKIKKDKSKGGQKRKITCFSYSYIYNNVEINNFVIFFLIIEIKNIGMGYWKIILYFEINTKNSFNINM